MSRNGNVINIESSDYPELTICLNSKMVNLSRRVTVKYQGRKLFKTKLKPGSETARQTLEYRGDPAYMFDCKIRLMLQR